MHLGPNFQDPEALTFLGYTLDLNMGWSLNNFEDECDTSKIGNYYIISGVISLDFFTCHFSGWRQRES